MGFWAAALPAIKGVGAASSLLGGLFGKKPKAQAQGVDYQRLVRDAQAAGFNPLTALAYGGSQAYTREYGPAMSRMSTVGQAMLDFAQVEYQNQVEQERLSLERDYYGLEARKTRVTERALEDQLAGVRSGPVFGPSARQGGSAPDTMHPDFMVGDREPGLYDAQSSEYGPAPAALEGGGRYLWQMGKNVIRHTAKPIWEAFKAGGKAAGQAAQKSTPPPPKNKYRGSTFPIF